MTTADVKKLLRDALDKKNEYILARDIKAEYERTLYGRSISYENDGSTHQHNGNKTEDSYVMLEKYSEDEKKARTEWILATQLANKLINSLRDSKQREVLKRHYINGKDWPIVANEMNYSESRIYQLHGIALVNIILNYSNNM